MPPKKLQTTIKLQLPAGKATPAPPVGTALGPHGVNIMDFCKQFNAKTQKEADGMIFPVLVSIYTDRSFTFILKTPPASVLLLRAAGIAKGSPEPNRNKVGKVTKKQVEEIAKIKLVDLNTTSLDSAVRTVMGTARNMGLDSRGSLRNSGRTGIAEVERMKKSGKKVEGARKLVEARPYKLSDATELIKKTHHAKFDETVELASTSASTPSIPIRWSAAPLSCRTVWASPFACWSSPAAISSAKPRGRRGIRGRRRDGSEDSWKAGRISTP